MRLLPLFLAGCSWIGGNFDGPPSELETHISPGALRLLEEVRTGIEPGAYADLHVHLAGLGADGTWINPRKRSPLHPVECLTTEIMMSAAGVDDEGRADEQYVARLVDLARHLKLGGRLFLYAMDRFHDAGGVADPERTEVFVPNERVTALALAYPDLFVPVISVHPYRADALAELEKWAGQGARFVKWIPNAMGIDPADARLDPFYRVMAQRRLVLLSHTGRERAVEAGDLQHLGNPPRLRRPLEAGVTVVALHCAADGWDEDLDDPARRRVPSFDLFLRLMDDPRHRERLYGEISSLTFFSNVGRPLETLLERTDLHPRLIHGSDYPICAINVVIRPGELCRRGYLTREEWGWLNEIYAYHPLLFDLAVKRTVRHPRTGARFAASVFSLPAALR